MEVKINKEIRNYTESMFLDCRSDSSFFRCLPAAWRLGCILFSVRTSERKPSVGYASSVLRPLR